jgi:ABC-type multidrug transport system fused ATPase/permease subunit
MNLPFSHGRKKTSEKSLKTLLTNAVWVYKLLFSLSRKDTLLYILSALYSAAIPTATAFYAAKLIDEVIRLAETGAQEISTLDISSPVVGIILLTTFFSLSTNLSRRINTYLFNRIRRYHLRNFEQILLYKISQLDIVQFEDPTISNEIQKAKDNLYKIEVFFQGSIRTLSDLVSTVISGVIVFSISPAIGFFIVIISIPNNLVFARFIREIWGYYNSFIEKNRKKWRLTYTLSYEMNIPEFKITKANKFVSGITKNITKSLGEKEMAIYFRRLRDEFFTSLLNATVYIISPLYLLGLVLKGTITIGNFTFYQTKILDFSRDLDYVFGAMLELSDSAVYITYVKNIMDLEPIIETGTHQLPDLVPPKITFKNVSFKYPRTKKYALKNINLTINPRDEIAIVGENGAGKTTLIRLILRFYEPTKGDILINDIPIRDISLSSYYNLIGALFQEYNRYNALTIKDNIRIGDISKKDTTKKMHDAAKMADAHDFIQNLEKKYNQVLSKDFTNGTNLSTGQWQKLSLARMFYRDRPILILDEPTASIDAQAEYKIFKRIYKMFEKKTVIIISHRFSTVRNADTIYVLKDGKITESGSHDELIKKNGVYANAFKLQAEGYQAKKV